MESAHKLVKQGLGAKAWGECSCGYWCWLGTYEMPKGRLAKLRAAHTEHLALVERGAYDEWLPR